MLKSKTNLIYILIMGSVYLYGYSIVATTMFGESYFQFSTALDSCMSLLKQLMKVLEPEIFYQDKGVLGLLLYFTFMLIFWFFIKNILTGLTFAEFQDFNEAMSIQAKNSLQREKTVF